MSTRGYWSGRRDPSLAIRRASVPLRILAACAQSELEAFVRPLTSRAGYELTAVTSGYELVTHVVQSLLYPEQAPLPALLIASQDVVHLSGAEAVNRVRRCGVRTPAILLCADAGNLPEDLEPVFVLEKPIRPEDLAYRVREALGRPNSGSRPIFRR